MLQYWFDEGKGEGASSILRKRSLRAYNSLLEPGNNLTPHERTGVFLLWTLLPLIRVSLLPQDVAHPNHYLISFEGFVLVGAEVSMSEGIEVGNIRHELIIEIDNSKQK